MSEYRFFSAWDSARRREEPMPWASCAPWDDPVRLIRQDACCGQSPIGACSWCGRWVYALHAKHWGPHDRHPDFEGESAGLGGLLVPDASDEQIERFVEALNEGMAEDGPR